MLPHHQGDERKIDPEINFEEKAEKILHEKKILRKSKKKNIF